LDLPAGNAPPSSPEPKPTSSEGQRLPLPQQVDAFRRRAIQAAVDRHQGNWAAAARELGMHRSNLHHLARRLGLQEPARRLY
ncbi:MAG TPA: helix-turn-helix domain-containing protein, partial [Candidatus Acidoferrum sp.]|nr:helix-turn-helix domain-containing protein [Candidatus Acidoferrum sp.]